MSRPRLRPERTLIVRHARAEPVSSAGEDRRRALTADGRERFRECVSGMETLGVRLDRIYFSPWLRAQETAELMGPLLSDKGEFLSCAELARAPSEFLLEELSGRDIALVGHEPWVGELCAWLVGGWPEDGCSLPFKKGGVALLEGERQPGRSHLSSFLPPRVLRSLARVHLAQGE